MQWATLDGVDPDARGEAVIWDGEVLGLLDQRALPGATRYLHIEDLEGAYQAIAQMVVRGAPAIGITAAYAVVLAARQHAVQLAPGSPEWRAALTSDLSRLASARPTAVNLAWAIRRMSRLIDRSAAGGPEEDLLVALARDAERIHAEDVDANRRMGELGAEVIEGRVGVLTHCNAGALATGGYGTALGVVRSAHAAGKIERVFADETRPWLQGARLTAWELARERIPVSLLAEGAASYAMQQGLVSWVVVGADRVAANGDVANKIGTYGLAVSARHHGVGFMVVAPTSTIDLDTPDGSGIPIELRDPDELLYHAGTRVAAAGAEAWNPVFDVTPAQLVDVLVTERGRVHAPSTEKIAAMMAPTEGC